MLIALRVPAGNERGPLYMDQALAALHAANPDGLPVDFVLGRIAVRPLTDEETKEFCRLARIPLPS